MAWPKGKSRKPVADGAAEDAPETKRKPLQARTRFTMKAGANWDNAEAESNTMGVDRYRIDREEIPEGFDLQWVAVSVYGQPLTQERAHFERKGWTPVHQSDFDGRFDGRYMAKGADGEINEGGQVLMARPLELSLKAKARELRAAREQVHIKEQALYGGDLGISGADHPSARKFNHINRSVERFEVPNDE